MTSHLDNVVERPADLTAQWLTAAVGAGTISAFSVERIGTGQMSECYRIALTYADGEPGDGRPDSVVLKVAATDPMSRQTGMTLGLYEREVCFYRDIAPRLHGPVAPCYHAAFDASSGIFDVLLGDANPAVVGDEIRGATTEQAQLAVTELARLQGPLLGDSTLAEAPWLNRDTPVNQALIAALYAGFVDRYGDRIARSTAWCANNWSARSMDTSPMRRPAAGSMDSCTATTGWTTCCSAPTGPTAR